MTHITSLNQLTKNPYVPPFPSSLSTSILSPSMASDGEVDSTPPPPTLWHCLSRPAPAPPSSAPFCSVAGTSVAAKLSNEQGASQAQEQQQQQTVSRSVSQETDSGDTEPGQICSMLANSPSPPDKRQSTQRPNFLDERVKYG